MSEFYCAPCGRPFNSQAALQMHLENARIHKSEATRQIRREQPRQGTRPRLPSSRPVLLHTTPLAQTPHSGRLSLIQDSNLNGTSKAVTGNRTARAWGHSDEQAGTAPDFHSQNSTGLQLQPENIAQSTAELARHLPPSSNFRTGLTGHVDPQLLNCPRIIIEPDSGMATTTGPLYQTTNMLRRSKSFPSNVTRPTISNRASILLRRMMRRPSLPFEGAAIVMVSSEVRSSMPKRHLLIDLGLQGKIEIRNRGGCFFHPGKRQARTSIVPRR
jgi:hypothetical protein